MILLLRYLILGCLVLFPVAGTASDKAPPPGFLQGHLHITSLPPVELADGDAPTATVQTYAEYPLVVLSQDGETEIARITANARGNYRIALPPGAYVLDMHNRVRKHLRAKPQAFTVVSNQTTRVDMDMDTGIR